MILVHELYARLQRHLLKMTKEEHLSSSFFFPPLFIQNAANVMAGASVAIINPETTERKACGVDERVLHS